MEREQADTRLREIGAAAGRARAELDHLIGQVEALRAGLGTAAGPGGETIPGPETVPEPEPPPIPEPTPPADPEPTPPPEVPPIPEPPPEPTPPTPGPPIPTSGNNDQAARLVALKLALDGSSREQIEAELAAKFGSADRSGLLDEVLARAGR